MKKRVRHNKLASKLKDIILGGQDGLVNVLGIAMTVAAATYNAETILIAGIAGLFAESVSMAAVAYTSAKAARDYYLSESRRNHRKFYSFVPSEYKSPLVSALIVGCAAIIGSLIPLTPFFFLDVKNAITTAWIISAAVLFAVGAVKAKLTIGDWKKSGLEVMIIGIVAAFAGYIIGKAIGIIL